MAWCRYPSMRERSGRICSRPPLSGILPAISARRATPSASCTYTAPAAGCLAQVLACRVGFRLCVGRSEKSVCLAQARCNTADLPSCVTNAEGLACHCYRHGAVPADQDATNSFMMLATAHAGHLWLIFGSDYSADARPGYESSHPAAWVPARPPCRLLPSRCCSQAKLGHAVSKVLDTWQRLVP